MKKQFLLFLFILSFLTFTSSGYSQWAMCNGMYGSSISALAVSGNNIFAGLYYGGVHLSTNNGTSWSQTALSVPWIRSIVINGNYIFAGADKGGLYRSTNNGASWTLISLNNRTIYALAISGSNILAGVDSNGVYLSTNNGVNWTQTNLNNKMVCALLASGNYVYAGTSLSGVYRSTNNGSTWVQTSLYNRSIYSLTISGNYIFGGAVSSGGVYYSVNNGANWYQTTLYNKKIRSLTSSGGAVFAGTADSGVFMTLNNGSTWFKKNQGFNIIPTVNSMLVLNGYVFAGTNGYSLWRRLYSEIIGIKVTGTGIPENYSLSQNYPNPFNPNTTIRFSIPSNVKGEMSNVKLIIFDVTGKEVITLMNEKQKPGTYEITFDGSDLSSGIYFYQLKTDNFIDTKKLILTK